MYVGETVRNTAPAAVAGVRKQLSMRDRTRLLADSAASLLDRMEQTHALGSVGTIPAAVESGALCQWVVELTYRMVQCPYVGIALVRDEALTIEPLAEAGCPTGDSQEWWAHVRSALLTERAARVADAPSIETPLIVRLPAQRAAPGRLAHPSRTACVVPIRVGGKLTAVFGSEAHGTKGTKPVPPTEAVILTRAMASIAASTIEAASLGSARGARDTVVLRAAPDEMDEMDGVLSWVSHELKSPLTTIMGCLQLIGPKVDQLARQVGSAGTEKTLASIQGRLALAIRHAEIEDRLATDLVDASRIRSAQMTLRPQPCNLGWIVRDSVDSQRIAASRRIIHLEMPDRDIPVSADPDRIMQVIVNLLGNALKYSPKESPVEVCVEVFKTHAKLSVRDCGPGLEKPDLTRVWQRFYRVAGVPAHNATGSGLGLGLYIAREIVRRHGGKVGVTSVPGRGSTFWFTLPLDKRA